MTKIIDILKSEYSTEYYLKKYSKPKIFPKVITTKPLSAFSKKEKSDILKKYKRWYVYYTFLNPASGKLERQSPIFFNVNREHPEFNDRVKRIKIIRNSIESILENGFSPYQNDQGPVLTTESCLNLALDIKKKEVKLTTFKDYEGRIELFKQFLKQQDFKYNGINNIDKKIVSKFLDTIPGAKNRNNTRAALSTIFTILSDKDIIEANFIKEIRNKKITEAPVVIYSETDVKRIIHLLDKEDKTLLMFVYFVSYMFWRPIEIVRIKVNDIDFENQKIKAETKTKTSKIKIIPDLIFEDLKTFAKNKKGYLFKPDNYDEWTIDEIAKRNYFTRRFSRFREKNGISKEFKLYSFRHTFITKIYLQLRNTKSKEETIKTLSLITGHESKAIHHYIRVNDVELPQDYSNFLK